MGIINKPGFPCSALPEDPVKSKLLGLYPQRQEGMWMQRIKIRGGVLFAEQWRLLAEMCRRYTPSTPLHLTTRQDLEFHNVIPENIPLLQADLAKAGITGLGACGDTLRNITLCPGNGICEGNFDFTGTAAAVQQLLEDFSEIYCLPRKFKISFSACPSACEQPWINDLGFVSDHKNGEVILKVIGAGSLGARPAAGIVIKEDLPLKNVPALALAAVRLFNTYGDRKNRSKARLRHVRERLGDSRFIEMLFREFDKCLRENLPSVFEAVSSEKKNYYPIELNIPYGAVDPELADAIANLSKQSDIIVRLQNHHRIYVFAINADSVLKALRADARFGSLLSGPDIAACPGTTFCKHALVNTHAVEKGLRNKLGGAETSAIRISGCPNGCAHSAVAEIGLSGRMRKDEQGNKVEGFQILVGGGMGRTPVLAETHTTFVPSEKVVNFIVQNI